MPVIITPYPAWLFKNGGGRIFHNEAEADAALADGWGETKNGVAPTPEPIAPAIEPAFDVGQPVTWTRGQGTHDGTIVEILGDRLLVKNANTGNDYKIDANDVVEVT